MWEQAERALNQSTTRMVTQFAGLLPGLGAFVVAVLVSILFAMALAAITQSILKALRFDQRLARSELAGITEWSPSGSPTLLVSRTVGWIVVVAGILVGVSAIDAAWATNFLSSLADYFPNLFGAALVLVVGNIAARFLARSVLIGAVNLNLQYARILSLGVKWLVLVLTVAMALEHLRIATGIVQLAFGILFGGIVLALALAVGLGSKEMVSRSLERETPAPPNPPASVEEPFHHV
jgi:hypothetical protein